MPRRAQLIPWRAAGRVSERYASGDDVVRETGWVFNNATGAGLTLAEFVDSGDHEVPTYLDLFELRGDAPQQRTFVEIGSGIGRMTCALTREFGNVVACDLDAGFLERCREVVAQFGRVEALRTLEVADGRTLALPDASADVAFSYITLQHCDQHDALTLAAEAVRVVRPGGRIALNFRSRSVADGLTLPLGGAVRRSFGVPGLGDWLSTRRTPTRLAWQANRVPPDAVLARLEGRLVDPVIWRHPDARSSARGAGTASFAGFNRHHWWLVATVA